MLLPYISVFVIAQFIYWLLPNTYLQSARLMVTLSVLSWLAFLGYLPPDGSLSNYISWGGLVYFLILWSIHRNRFTQMPPEALKSS